MVNVIVDNSSGKSKDTSSSLLLILSTIPGPKVVTEKN